ncbi:MAG: hypothetical protein DWQ36_10420 [Acidobacteria bacterium]|nr:MAG: hypothetical protein DWQ30_23085 [Acidobacteriota bacterium]REK07915.1 MAG: hypothetical protein DWQ36_10420 [Acidobacteriota bacterium]
MTENPARPTPAIVALAVAGLVTIFAALPLHASVRAAKPSSGPDPAVATVVVDAVIARITAEGTLVLRPEEEGAEPIELRLPEEVRIRAQRKKDFDGRRKLEFADLRVGQRLRLTVLPAENRLVGVTVLKLT